MTPLQQHCERWRDGCGSDQCARAKNRVLVRGTVPCDVLLIGEAPGESEDVLGRPFVGPAGKLLDGIVGEADPGELAIAFTNVVACIPRDDLTGTKKAIEPDLEQIAACRGRLEEIIDLCRPKLVVRVGKLAQKHVGASRDYKVVDIVHPAAILRAPAAQQSLMRKRAVVTLTTAFQDLRGG